jgi:hypothetical protein
MIGPRMAATASAQTKSLHGVEPWLRGLLDRHDHIVLLCVGPYLSVFVVGHGTALADLPPPLEEGVLGARTPTPLCAQATCLWWLLRRSLRGEPLHQLRARLFAPSCTWMLLGTELSLSSRERMTLGVEAIF